MKETTDSEQHERIENYLRGNLSEIEQSKFELMMFEEPAFALEVESHQLLKLALKNASSSNWVRENRSSTKAAWWASALDNAKLAWLVAGGCAAALLLSITLADTSNRGFVLTNEIAISSFRGNNPLGIEATVTSRSAGEYVLISVDTSERSSPFTLALLNTDTPEPFFTAAGTTDKFGTLRIALPAARISAGVLGLNVKFEDGTQNDWEIVVR